MKKNPRVPSSTEFQVNNAMLKGSLLAFADWFSSAFHDGEATQEDFEDAAIQTLALANMAMVEALSIRLGRRISVLSLLEPVVEKTLVHEESQKNCPHRASGLHDCMVDHK